MTRLILQPAITLGEPVALAEGLYRLSLPMRANPGHVNSYLLVDGDGLVIVDTGHRTDETRVHWENVLQGPLAAGGVRKIVLTHGHPDHAGNAQWLAERTGAPVWMADAEFDAMHRLWRGSVKEGEAVTAFFHRWGIPQEQCLNILGMLGYFRHGCPAIEAPVHSLNDGDTLLAGGRRWQVMFGSGHTPANAALLSDDGWLLSGDHLLPTIYPNISVWWGATGNPLRDYLESLERFASLSSSLTVLPSHGPMFRDLEGRIEEIRRFHVRRLQRTLAHCRDEARTAYESIVAVVNKPSVSPVIALIAGQVIAALAWLEAEGLVQQAGDHPLRFRAVPEAEEILRSRFGAMSDALETVEEGDDA